VPRHATEEEEEEDNPLSVLAKPVSTATESHLEILNKGVTKRVGIQAVLENGG
jgi:hydroxymethylpyrimidine pyrophosphatase-like HAD family hydrolase